MQISALRRYLLLLLVFASPAFLHAQFQEPTPEELKMTADPKAPGAAAVYLNVEEIANDELHFQSVYLRIKVLQEKGKELATVELPYLRGDWKVTDIRARTIHSDGTIIPLTGKPEDLLIAKTSTKTGDQMEFSRKIFNLPSVEIGSI
ncbi:MAG: transglutaminase, partial [Terracidiphilus sp.]